MNYYHDYHAGNFADVFKHSILILLLKSFLKKEKPFVYIDTHAGRGYYDLNKTQQKTQHESKEGIHLIQNQVEHLPAELTDYWKIIKGQNSQQKQIQFYPGSPFFAQILLRATDKMLLVEWKNDVFSDLKQLMAYDKRATVLHHNGYLALKSLLPPTIRRGLVLIDPPFEDNDEFISIAHALEQALQRWQIGTYIVWYPIKTLLERNKFYRDLLQLNANEILLAELCIHDENIQNTGLNGCGIAILNPPWKLDEQLNTLLPFLWQCFSPKKRGYQRVEWIKRENT